MKKKKEPFDANKEWWKIAELISQQNEILKDYIQWILDQWDCPDWQEIQKRAEKALLDADTHTLKDSK